MATDVITITVSAKEDVDWIRNQVRSGSFSSEAEVIAEALARQRDENADVDSWLRNTAGPRYDRHKADPSTAISHEQLEKNLEEHRQKRFEPVG